MQRSRRAAAAVPEAPSAAATRVFGGQIAKSPNDSRDYQAVQLANGLRAILVSDPAATSAAAALSVHAGFYLDPDELSGLAHFCEHMLFLGTKDFPGENSLRQFLTANGGSQNAFTTEQDTTYYFYVSPPALQDSLVRFSSFFKSPLFTPSATARELGAIESEDAKNRQDDSFRLNQLTKSFAAEGHPQRKFGTGNLETLLAEPQRRGLDTRAALLDFFGRYYDASLMTLCVVGREPTGTLLRWAEDSFGVLVGRGLPSPYRAWRGVDPFPPAKSAGELKMVQAVPVASRRLVSVTWTVVFQDDAMRMEWLRCKPAGYVSFLVGHEGEGSLLSLLKRRGWATGVTAGVFREDDNFATVQVKLQLTEAGLQMREAALGALHAVLRRLRSGVPDYIFEEQAALAEIRWEFQPRAASDALSVRLVQQMQRGFEPEEYLSGGALYFQPGGGRSARDAVAELLAQMTPDRARYSSVARSFAAEAQQSERWFGTRYSVAPISEETLRRWQNSPPLADYSLPKPNPFVPRDFRLKTTQASFRDLPEAAAEPPELVEEGPRLRAFFKPDRCFATPKATVQLLLWLPGEEGAAGSDTVASRVWLLSLKDRLTEAFYDARCAGLGVDVQITAEGLSLSFGGYSDRLVLLVESALGRLRSFDGPSPGEFDRALDVVMREQDSLGRQKPYQYALYQAQLAIASPGLPLREIQRQAAAVTPESARAAGRRFASTGQRLFAQVLMQGNLDKREVRRVLQALEGLPFQPAPLAQLRGTRVAQLPMGQDFLVLSEAPNPDETNQALRCVLYTGSTPEEWVMTLLLQAILEAPFYSRLRTDQQLGYVVLSGADRAGLVARLALVVQSSTAEPGALLAAVDEFLRGFRPRLEGMAPREFSRFKVSLVERIVKPDERLAEEAARWWDEISSFQYGWRRRSEEATIVTKITLPRLLDFFDSRVAPGAPGRRRLESAVFSGAASRQAMERMRAEAEVRGAAVVQDPTTFRDSLPRWPVIYRSPTESL